MELIINKGNKAKVGSANVHVRWTLSNEELDMLEGQSALVVVQLKYNKHYFEQFVFPLNQCQAFIAVTKSGKVKLSAMCINYYFETKQTEDLFEHVKYKILDEQRELQYYSTGRFLLDDEYAFYKVVSRVKTVVLDVDKKLFYSDIPEALKFVAYRYWYKQKPKDACEVRRRLIIFCLINWWLFIAETSLRIVVTAWRYLFAFLCGIVLDGWLIKNIFTRAFKENDWDDNIFSIWTLIEDIDKDLIAQIQSGPIKLIVTITLFCLTPIVQAIAFCLARYLNGSDHSFAYYWIVGVSNGIAAAIGIVLIIFVLSLGSALGLDVRNIIREKFVQWKKPKIVKYDRNVLTAEVEPTKDIYYIFSELKSKVCKPISR